MHSNESCVRGLLSLIPAAYMQHRALANGGELSIQFQQAAGQLHPASPTGDADDPAAGLQDFRRQWILPEHGGKDITADYTVEQKVLGKGSFAVTYLVTCKKTGMRFACKSVCKAKVRTSDLPHVMLGADIIAAGAM